MQELEQSQGLESPEDTKRRLRSVYVCHLSMLLSGFGNSVIYIGMFPYISSVGSNDLAECWMRHLTSPLAAGPLGDPVRVWDDRLRGRLGADDPVPAGGARDRQTPLHPRHLPPLLPPLLCREHPLRSPRHPPPR